MCLVQVVTALRNGWPDFLKSAQKALIEFRDKVLQADEMNINLYLPDKKREL